MITINSRSIGITNASGIRSRTNIPLPTPKRLSLELQEKIVKSLLAKVINFLKENRTRAQSIMNVHLINKLSSGGVGGTLFSCAYVKLRETGENLLIMSINRRGDRSAQTSAFVFIRTLKTSFPSREEIQEGITLCIKDLSIELQSRAMARAEMTRIINSDSGRKN